MEKLVGKGWTVPSWPEKYGGAGLSKEEEKVLKEEMSAIGTYSPLYSFGISMLAPALMEYATKPRLERLPKVAGGEIRWCRSWGGRGREL